MPKAKTKPKFDLDEAINLYNSGKTIVEIAKLLNSSETSVHKYLTLAKVNISNKIDLDETIFDNIDSEEKAYWLGFIYADGNISKNIDRFEMNLGQIDLEHMNKFKDFLKYKGEIRFSTKFNDRYNKSYTLCRISSRSIHLVQTLNSCGCIPNKSLMLEFPNENIFKDKSLIKHFIRGYWDGDGSLTYNDKAHRNPECSLLGTE